jgi:hypothetical protein
VAYEKSAEVFREDLVLGLLSVSGLVNFEVS